MPPRCTTTECRSVPSEPFRSVLFPLRAQRVSFAYPTGSHEGCLPEVFHALGRSIAVVTVVSSDVGPPPLSTGATQSPRRRFQPPLTIVEGEVDVPPSNESGRKLINLRPSLEGSLGAIKVSGSRKGVRNLFIDVSTAAR